MTIIEKINYIYNFEVHGFQQQLTSKYKMSSIIELQEYFKKKIKKLKYHYFPSAYNNGMKPSGIIFYSNEKYLIEFFNIFDIGPDIMGDEGMGEIKDSGLGIDEVLKIFDKYKDGWK